VLLGPLRPKQSTPSAASAAAPPPSGPVSRWLGPPLDAHLGSLLCASDTCRLRRHVIYRWGVMRHSPTLAGGEQQGSADQPIKQVPAGKLAGPAQVQGSIHCRDGPGKLELRGVIGQIVV